ncbi:MAG: pirin family protein [Pseudomonadota bacterium]
MIIREIVEPSVDALGPLLVRHILPSLNRQMVGPFISMDQCGPTRLMASNALDPKVQPYAGCARLTYLLEGGLIHRDSAGGFARIGPGDVALMTAGSGVMHEEVLAPYRIGSNQDVYFLHFWMALPDGAESIEPAFELHRHAELPELAFEDGYAWILVGSVWGRSAPTTSYTDTLLVDFFLRPGGETPIPTGSEECAIYLLDGAASLNGQSLEPHKLIVFDVDSSPILSSKYGCRAVLLGGAVFRTARFTSGSFVASSEVKLSDRIEAYKRGEFPNLLSAFDVLRTE